MHIGAALQGCDLRHRGENVDLRCDGVLLGTRARRTLGRVFRAGRTVKPLGDLVSDKLPGLGVAVYVASPAGW